MYRTSHHIRISACPFSTVRHVCQSRDIGTLSARIPDLFMRRASADETRVEGSRNRKACA